MSSSLPRGGFSHRVALLFFVAGIFTALCAAESERPNILFIYTDDHSYRTVSAYPQAYPWVKTPTIDRLAREGVRFESAYIGTWCMPSRATLLTGHHQSVSSRCAWRGRIRAAPTIPNSAPSGPKRFATTDTSRPTSANGTRELTPDTAATGTSRCVWNRPRFTKTNQYYYYDQPITYQGGGDERAYPLLDRPVHRLGD